MRTFMVAGLFGLVLSVDTVAGAPPVKPSRPGAAATTATPAVTRVTDTSKVCMVNDRYMAVEQIPVAVEGRTYYGCCPMCKDRLAQDTAIREAIDPVSGRSVDKAKAVIGKRPDGTVVYFESVANLKRYRPPAIRP